MTDHKKQFTRTYILWFVGTVFCTLIPLGVLLSLEVPPIIAGCVAFGVFAGGFSGGVSSAYKLGVKHGASAEPG